MIKQTQSVVAKGSASTGKGWYVGALLALGLLTAGCGQKGPLYLPTAQKAAAPAPAASAARP